jgi:hypothetical protein
MLYKENMIENLKALRALDYPVLANLFATYAPPQLRTASRPAESSILGRSHPDLAQQALMLWRAAQLLSESPHLFFQALLDLYQIDDDFVRNLIVNLLRIKHAGEYRLEYLSVESTRLPRDIVAFSLEAVPRRSRLTYSSALFCRFWI